MKRKTTISSLIKLLFVVGLFMLNNMAVLAQTAGSYVFTTNSNASLVADANGNAISSGSFSATIVPTGDDERSSATTFGFTFPYSSTNYTQFSASSNGGIRLGATQISTTLYGSNIPTASQPLLMPYFGDLKTIAASSVKWQVVGSSPSRCLVIQFSNLAINYGGTTSDGTFQARLYETSGVIEFVYGAMKVSATTGGSTSVVIGLQTTTGANNNITVDQSTYATTNTATATVNTNSSLVTIAGLDSALDGSRRRFIFKPPLCTTPSPPTTLALTAVTGGGSMTGTFTAPGTVPTGYLVVRTTSSTPPTTPVSGTVYAPGSSALGGYIVSTNTTTGISDSGLSPSTPYWYWVYSYNNSFCTAVYSTSISATKTTLTCATATNTMTVSSSGTYNWNTASNWSLSHVPYPCENVVINGSGTINGTASVILNSSVLINSLTVNLSGAGNVAAQDILNFSTGIYNLVVTADIAVNNTSAGNGAHQVATEASLGGSITCNNMSVIISGSATNNNAYLASVNSYGTININGTTTANATQATGQGGQILFNVDDLPAQINFNGNAVFDSGTTAGNSSIYIGTTAASGNTSGRMVFKANATFGAKAFSIAANIHGTTVFDAVSSQTVTVNNATTMFFPSVIIGDTNSPIVTFAGTGNAKVSSSSSTPISVLVGTNAVLNLGTNTLNLDASAASSFTLSSGATLKLAGTTGGQTGSNFPLNFGTVTLDPTSTVEYNGATQTIYNTPTYGNLTISTSGTKTPAGNLSVARNFLINSPATFAASTFTHAVGGDWTNNGTFTVGTSRINFNGTTQAIGGSSASIFNNVSLLGTGTKTFSNATTFNGNLTIGTGAIADLNSLRHSAATLTFVAAAQSTGTSYGGTGSPASVINSTYFAANTGYLNVACATTYSLTGTSSPTVCIGSTATVVLTSSAVNLPVGTYTVYYTLGAPNAGIGSASMSVTTAGTGSFVTSALANSGSTSIMVNYIRINCVTTLTSGNTGTITVQSAVTAGSIAAAQTICNNTTPSGLTSATAGTGSGTITYRWESNTNLITPSWSSVGVATASYNPGALTVTTQYRRITISTLNSVACESVPTSTIQITVQSVPTAGSIAVAQTICNNTAPSGLTNATAGTGDGTITYRWESNTNLITPSWSSVGVASATYSPGVLTVTTQYRRITISTLNSVACESAPTSTIQITVTPDNTVGAGSSSPSLCVNTVMTNITHNTTGATGIGTATGLPAGVTASWSGNVITISGTPTTGIGSPFNYSIPLTGGCGTVNATGTITVSTVNTWTGGASTTVWTTGGNWSCGLAPTAVNDVVIGSASFYPVISSDVTINSLTLDSGTTLKVNSLYDLTVADVIDNDGTLTIENSANLLQNNNVTNTGLGSTIVKRNSNPLIRMDYTLWSSPVTGQGLYAFSPLTLSNRFYKYNPTIISPATEGAFSNSVGFSMTGLDGNNVNGTDSNNVPFATGTGYLIRLPWNHPTAPAIWNGKFTGTPNNGNLNVTITDTGDHFNAVGNPYPSPINIANFASDNASNIESTLYFWRKTNNAAKPSYCAWNTNTGTFGDNNEAYSDSPLGVIQTGQGFFVEAKTGASNLVFNNAQRIGDNANQFFKTAAPTANNTAALEANRIWLNMTNASSGFSQSVIGYFTNSTLGVDDTDSKYFNDGPIAFTSTIANNDYVIQGRPVPFDTSDVVPMKFKVTIAGTYSIAIDHVDGLFTGGSQAIYVKDNLTATLHNLNTGVYTFASAAGTFDSRFEIVYADALGVNNPVFNANNVVIYSQNNGFVINSGNFIMSSVKVFDIRGRLIEEKSGINASQTNIKGGLANEVLLVQITSEDGVVVTKKVIK